jgi:hypothetical protein
MRIPPLRYGHAAVRCCAPCDALCMTYLPRDLDKVPTSSTQRGRGRADRADTRLVHHVGDEDRKQYMLCMVYLHRHLGRVPTSYPQSEREYTASKATMEQHRVGDEEGKQYTLGLWQVFIVEQVCNKVCRTTAARHAPATGCRSIRAGCPNSLTQAQFLKRLCSNICFYVFRLVRLFSAC